MGDMVILDRWQLFFRVAVAFAVGAAAGYEWRVLHDVLLTFF